VQFTPSAPGTLARIGNRGTFLVGLEAFPGAEGRTNSAAFAPSAEYIDIELFLTVRLPALGRAALPGPFRLAALAGPGHFGLIFDVFHHILCSDKVNNSLPYN
jgi:hypothetical protein